VFSMRYEILFYICIYIYIYIYKVAGSIPDEVNEFFQFI
jgi:hypothetical protein